MAVDITFQRESLQLHGKMYAAQGPGPLPTVLLLQGSPGNELDVLDLGQKLSQRDYNVLTFNYSGTYRSDGEWSFPTTQQDIRAAYAFLHKAGVAERFHVDTSRLILGGYSYGGGMALTYAASHPEVTSVFSIAGTDHGEFMREYARDASYHAMIDEMFTQLKQPGSPLRPAPNSTPREIFEQDLDMTPYDLRASVPALADKQILLVGGWDDLNVKIENHMLPLYRELTLQGADQVCIRALQDDHAFLNVRDELADVVLKWLASIEA